MTEPYTIAANDRAFMVGKTGSGKSTAARRLVWDRLDDCIFYDMTGSEESHLNAPVLRDLDHVQQALFPEDVTDRLTKFVYSPEVPTYEGFERLCELVYSLGNIHLIADELMLVYRDGNHVRPTTDHHLKILTNGRKRGVGLTGCTQRPVNVPLESISESEHLFCFLLKLPTDTDRMRKVMGPAVQDAQLLQQYWFYYDHDALQEPDLREPLQV
jgi:DNA helicase HerA-like ATPase